MTAPALPLLGSVVWAELQDANGFRKLRPAVVISPTASIAPGQPVRLVAITTRLPAPLPTGHVLLPWERQGRARSGLRRPCAAVASWQVEILAEEVQQVVGILPPGVVTELLAQVAITSRGSPQRRFRALAKTLMTITQPRLLSSAHLLPPFIPDHHQRHYGFPFPDRLFSRCHRAGVSVPQAAEIQHVPCPFLSFPLSFLSPVLSSMSPVLSCRCPCPLRKWV